MKIQKHRSILVSVIVSNFLSQLYSRKLWFRVAVFTIFTMGLIFGGIRDKAEELILNDFGKHVSLSFEKYTMDKTIRNRIEKKVYQKFFKNFIYVWKITKNDTIIGYALLDNVKGKTMPITILVNFGTAGTIRSTHVVKYREAIGGEIENRRWNSQFAGRSYKSSFLVGSEIDGISGATISVNSMTAGVMKLSLLFKEIKDNL